MCGGLDDHEPAVVRTHDVARLGETGRDRFNGALTVLVARRDESYRSVVRVGDEYRTVRQRADAERMLEQRSRRWTVHQAEVEQSLTGGGVHLAVVYPADRRRVAIGDPQPVARDREP